MKKVVVLFTFIFLLTGCVDVNNSSYENIIEYAINNEKVDLKNESGSGFSYYLPKGIQIVKDNKNNLVLKEENYKLYMYVDLISYYNKIKETYNKKTNVYYSEKIEKEDKFGYLEIKERTDKKYLVEIMYNYAKIEVIVDECDIKNIVSYAMAILTSISYNDTIIENMIGDDILNYNEVEFNIFETADNESNLIIYDDESTTTVEDYNDVPDTDLIN